MLPRVVVLPRKTGGRTSREAGGEGGANEGEVDNKGLKRTGSHIMLKVKEILVFRANELRGVKPFAMLGMDANFRETFIPVRLRFRNTLSGEAWRHKPTEA